MPDYYNIFLESMHLQDFRESTQKVYILYIKQFLEYADKPPQLLSLDDARAFLLFLRDVKNLKASTINGYNSAIKYFFQYILDIPWSQKLVPRMKETVVQPRILSQTEVFHFIESMDNLKYKAIAATLYSSGLRVGEVVRLRYDDISRSRRTIHVADAKSRSDRYAILSERNLELLSQYWMDYGKPKGWLFLSRMTGMPLTVNAVQSYFKKHSNALCLRHNVNPHLLRHCFATHLLEDGVNIDVIQQLLGHVNPYTTSRYLHLTSKYMMGIKSPFDRQREMP